MLLTKGPLKDNYRCDRCGKLIPGLPYLARVGKYGLKNLCPTCVRKLEFWSRISLAMLIFIVMCILFWLNYQFALYYK